MISMELNISENMKNLLLIFFMILLPLIVLGLGALIGVRNPGYYILSIFWFGMGIVFFNAID
jgi:uncharacterized membrane protein YfhO